MIVISIINKKRINICRLQGIKIECFLSKYKMCIEFQLLEFHIVPIINIYYSIVLSKQLSIFYLISKIMSKKPKKLLILSK